MNPGVAISECVARFRDRSRTKSERCRSGVRQEIRQHDSDAGHLRIHIRTEGPDGWTWARRVKDHMDRLSAALAPVTDAIEITSILRILVAAAERLTSSHSVRWAQGGGNSVDMDA